MKYVIFSTDDQSPFGVHNFNDYLKSVPSAGEFIPCIGSYKGKTEWSWLCRMDDFTAFVVPSGMVKEQESILQVSECNKQYAVLLYQDGTREGIGSLKNVSREEALKHDAWTYRPDSGIYWIAVQGNPDTIPPAEGWMSQSKKQALKQAIFLLENDMRSGHNEAAQNLRTQFFPN